MDVERHNLAQIERLNQRGGRTLSIVDLIEDGTITAEMAALCWLAVEHGGGFVTGAVPGGAGKTSLMAALLAFLPPGEKITTVADRSVIDAALSGAMALPATLLAHEIGSGHWFGYIWGRDAADFFSLAGQGLRCVSCLHADTPEQTQQALSSLGVAEGDLGRLALQLFMHMGGGRRRIVRRVSGLHCFLDGRLRTLYRWRPTDDAFEPALDRREVCALLGAQYAAPAQQVNARWQHYEGRLRALQEEGVRSFAQVRRRIVQAYGA